MSAAGASSWPHKNLFLTRWLTGLGPGWVLLTWRVDCLCHCDRWRQAFKMAEGGGGSQTDTQNILFCKTRTSADENPLTCSQTRFINVCLGRLLVFPGGVEPLRRFKKSRRHTDIKKDLSVNSKVRIQPLVRNVWTYGLLFHWKISFLLVWGQNSLTDFPSLLMFCRSPPSDQHVLTTKSLAWLFLV